MRGETGSILRGVEGLHPPCQPWVSHIANIAHRTSHACVCAGEETSPVSLLETHPYGAPSSMQALFPHNTDTSRSEPGHGACPKANATDPQYVVARTHICSEHSGVCAGFVLERSYRTECVTTNEGFFVESNAIQRACERDRPCQWHTPRSEGARRQDCIP